MIFGQAFNMICQCPAAGSRDNPGLPHRATHAMFPAPCLIDKFMSTRQHRPDRAAETFTQIEPQRINSGCKIRCRDAGGDDSIHQPRTVHVQVQTLFARDSRNLLKRRQWPDGAATSVRCLFHNDQTGPGLMIGTVTNRFLNVFRIKDTAITIERTNEGP